MIGLPTHERLRRIERHLKDHDAKFETIEEELDLTDPGFVKSEAVYVREDISVSDGFEDLSEWVPDSEEEIPPREPYDKVARIGDIELFQDADGEFVITSEAVRRGNEDAIYVEPDDLVNLLEMVDMIQMEADR